jgi:hypothetical protein
MFHSREDLVRGGWLVVVVVLSPLEAERLYRYYFVFVVSIFEIKV